MYKNPYSGMTFFPFLEQFFWRVLDFLQGKLAIADLVSDEIQVLVLMGVAASAALVGSFLVLRKMTMLANSLSHTILIGIVLVFLMSRAADQQASINIQWMLAAAIIMGIVTTFLTEFLNQVVKLQEDASIGIVFTSLFALGIVLVTLLTRSSHIGTEAVMGNVDALHIDDCKLVYTILAINIGLYLLFFKEYQVTTFDPGLAKATGISPRFFSYLLMVQTSATVIGAFRAVGVLMVLAFLTGPVLTARLMTNNLKRMILIALLLGCFASLIGVALSRHLLSVYGLALSTAGIVVCTIVLIFLGILLISPSRGLIHRLRHTSK